MKTVIAKGPSVGMTIKMHKLPEPVFKPEPVQAEPSAWVNILTPQNIEIESGGIWFDDETIWKNEFSNDYLTLAINSSLMSPEKLYALSVNCSDYVSVLIDSGDWDSAFIFNTIDFSYTPVYCTVVVPFNKLKIDREGRFLVYGIYLYEIPSPTRKGVSNETH